MTKRKCALCGGSPLTKEHGWPQWLEKVLPNTPIWQTDIPDDFIPRRRGVRRSVAGAEVRGICKSCNNGWMSDLETAAQPVIGPMILGRETHLSQQTQIVVATWLIKTCLVLSLGNPSRGRIEQAYSELFYAHIPSVRNRIAIGGFVGHEKMTTVFHFQPMTIINKDQVNSPNHIRNVYIMTLAIGRFVGQVVHTELSERFKLKGNRLHEIWPYEKDFTWPPLPLFTPNELQWLAFTEYPWLTPPPKSSDMKWTDI